MNPLSHVLTSQIFIGPKPTREEFLSWTIRKRHDFIKHHFGKDNLKRSYPGDWCYLIYCAKGWAVRFKFNRKREIISTEVIDASQCADLIRQSELADAAIHQTN